MRRVTPHGAVPLHLQVQAAAIEVGGPVGSGTGNLDEIRKILIDNGCVFLFFLFSVSFLYPF